MQSAVVFPLHDKDGPLFSHLQKITPDLKKIFQKAYVSITPPTLELQKGSVENLAKDEFFELVYNQPGSQAGDHYLAAFKLATQKSQPSQTLHLVTLDRLAYILETEHRQSFLTDIVWAEKQNRPVLFLRSTKAWQTHPENYYAIESMATRLGEILFHKTLDFAWCHLVLKSSLLKPLLPKFKAHDFTVFAELAMFLKGQWQTKEVDWLVWEDPFIFGKDPEKFKAERESSAEENERRLGYIIPIIRSLSVFSCC